MDRNYKKLAAHHPGNISLTTALGLVASVLVCAFGAFEAVQTEKAAVSGVVAASDPAYLNARQNYQTILRPIESLEVGDRVRADAPTDEFDSQFGTENIPADWRKLTLTAPKDNGTVSDITLIRPLWWIEQQNIVENGQFHFSVPHCGIDGNADVQRIEPCPLLENGQGQVITGTFHHRVSGGLELLLEGSTEPTRCTGNHPFWSDDRKHFIPAEDLELGETLRTATGSSRLLEAAPIDGATSVFNIEVFGSHVYHVGTGGTLVHNGDQLYDPHWKQYADWASGVVASSMGFIKDDLIPEFGYAARGIKNLGRADFFHRQSGTAFEATMYAFQKAESPDAELLRHKMDQLWRYEQALRDEKSNIQRLVIVTAHDLPKKGPGAEYLKKIDKLQKAGLDIEIVRLKDCKTK